MSNNSCDGSVWNVLTGKSELRPKEAFTSKRLGFVSSCGGFSHTWWAVQTCHPSDNESKWGVPISAGANQQHLDKQLNSPQTSDGTGGKGRFTAKMLIGRCFQIGPLFWSYQEMQIGMKQGNVICVTVNICITHVCMYGCIASTANSL